MKNTIITYETYYGTSKKAAESLALIIGNCKTFSIDDVPEDIDAYDNVISVFSFHGSVTADKTKKYLKSLGEKLNKKFFCLVGVGLYEGDVSNYRKVIEEYIQKEANLVRFIEGEVRINKLTKQDKDILEGFFKTQNIKFMDMGKFKMEEVCKNACEIKEILNKDNVSLDSKELKKILDDYIMQKNTCSLTTGIGDFVRSTPIEYVYHKDCFYFFTEGGLKFNGILQNPNVAISIYDDYTGMNKLKGLQVSGRAEVIPLGSDEYKELIGVRKLNFDMINKFPINLNLLKVSPVKFEFLNSDFKNMGVEVKQIFEC